MSSLFIFKITHPFKAGRRSNQVIWLIGLVFGEESKGRHWKPSAIVIAHSRLYLYCSFKAKFVEIKLQRSLAL
jgi:hypothetical protein